VVHMSSGYSALVACILVGQRQDVDRKKPVVPHNVPFVLLGAAILVRREQTWSETRREREVERKKEKKKENFKKLKQGILGQGIEV
jgi:hypothetical protein